MTLYRMELPEGWLVEAILDDYFHLNLFISNADGTDIMDISNDQTPVGEISFRLTTQQIEDDHEKSQEETG